MLDSSPSLSLSLLRGTLTAQSLTEKSYVYLLAVEGVSEYLSNFREKSTVNTKFRNYQNTFSNLSIIIISPLKRNKIQTLYYFLCWLQKVTNIYFHVKNSSWGIQMSYCNLSLWWHTFACEFASCFLLQSFQKDCE